MLSRKTVFVLGAGASFELNLPVGETLKEDIAKLLNITFPDGYNQKSGDRQICETLRIMARSSGRDSINYYLNKCRTIKDALPGALSIDNLLDAHRNDPDIPNLGKMAIAKAVLNAERSSKLFKRDHEKFNLSDVSDTWMIPLLQILTENLAKEEVDSIFDNSSFIVFNYDRCLEHFLPRALEIYYGMSAFEALNLVERANIIHPYGRVGEFTKGNSLEAVAFGSDRYDIQRVAEGIRTFSEGLKSESHRESITEMIKNAEQIVFLGFAFHPLNMEILQIQGRSNIKKVFGTTIGLSEAAVRSVEYTILNLIKKRDPKSIDLFDETNEKLEEMNLEARPAVEFFRAHFRGIS